MYVRGGARLQGLLWRDRKSLFAVALIAVASELLEPQIPSVELFSVVYVGVFSTALSIFLVFRFNEAYERWWEARKLWGALVNVSRDFARQVTTLLDGLASDEERKRLVYRQIAYVHALRIRLREGATPSGHAQVRMELERLLPEEAGDFGELQNIPSGLLNRQSADLARLLGGSSSDRLLLTRLDSSLAGMHDVQGGCERINNTVFPDMVTMMTRTLVWALVVLLMLATLNPDEGRGGLLATVAVCLMATGYLWIDSLGHMLKDPFENQPSDTPMTSLCVTIERDLREMLGETELPEPVRPHGGVLM